MMQALELGQPVDETQDDLPQADDIRIGEIAPVMHVVGNAVALSPMKFGFPPASPRSGPVFNFKQRAATSTKA